MISNGSVSSQHMSVAPSVQTAMAQHVESSPIQRMPVNIGSMSSHNKKQSILGVNNLNPVDNNRYL
jgi:hypothetical protein